MEFIKFRILHKNKKNLNVIANIWRFLSFDDKKCEVFNKIIVMNNRFHIRKSPILSL